VLKHPTRKLPLWLTVANLLLLAIVAGCGDDGTAIVRPESDGNGPVVAHSSAGDGSGLQALIEGELSMDDGCLLVGDTPVVWPHGTTWDADTRTVRLPKGDAIAPGDRVRGSGGYPYRSDLGDQLADALEDCPMNEHPEVAMFNAGEQIIVTGQSILRSG
jgi:hypothetical protein